MTLEAFKGYLKGNCMKYLHRYEKKQNQLEDLKKCRWYLEKLISIVEECKVESMVTNQLEMTLEDRLFNKPPLFNSCVDG